MIDQPLHVVCNEYTVFVYELQHKCRRAARGQVAFGAWNWKQSTERHLFGEKEKKACSRRTAGVCTFGVWRRNAYHGSVPSRIEACKGRQQDRSLARNRALAKGDVTAQDHLKHDH